MAEICQNCYMSGCSECEEGLIQTPTEVKITKERLRSFASEEKPLHASALPELINCCWKLTVGFLLDLTSEGSEAADTGSAMHVAVAEWHRNEQKVDAAIEIMKAKMDRYQKANLDEAAHLFRLYTKDPRNQEAKFATYEGEEFIEKKISITLEPTSNDPTQEKIYIVGTIDQIRLNDNGKPSVWDLKTSKRPGWDLMNMYLYQLAAYCLGASKLLRVPVSLGGLITPRHYKGAPESRPLGVFWNYPHKFNDVGLLMNGVRLVVARIRSGEFHISPGPHCHYCHLQTTNDCLSILGNISVETE